MFKTGKSASNYYIRIGCVLDYFIAKIVSVQDLSLTSESIPKLNFSSVCEMLINTDNLKILYRALSYKSKIKKIPLQNSLKIRKFPWETQIGK